MKIREHRGSLQDSLATTVEIEPTKAAVAEYLFEVWGTVLPINIRTHYYGYDERIAEDLYIITANNLVLGFCNQEVKG